MKFQRILSNRNTRPPTVKKLLRVWVEDEKLCAVIELVCKHANYREVITLRFENEQAAETLEALAWKNVLNHAEEV